ncbi:transmembrane protein, putative (macronuclear) [Tetrahymena thermophila SB210]|uniref:Transmembrane protein, putative n=1 Tax=Tetrahymena thermophila (strain SB210) TaxID=312017 RepID=Q22TI1_TETTS|nr:transmembrane protein, putative [Tetrahymena thermophila SB210]EAR88457.1 transmembrane protein, putative [Tetrahymena thermophila SB210]|eukprot:XP_001008702.1 transmembrane protein, putative [Tetrahymena thermophila SB210]
MINQYQNYILIILLLSAKLVFGITSSSYDFIFQQIQFPPQLFSTKQQISSTSSNKDYTVVSFLTNGIKWIDNNKQQPIDNAINTLIGKSISAIAITQDSQFLFTSCDNRLSMYSVLLKQNFNLIQIKQSKEQYGVITNIYLVQNDKIAILLGDKGAIIAYDIQSKLQSDSMPILATYFAKSNNIMGFIRITDDFKWIFVADLSAGVYVLKLTITLDSNQQVTAVTMPQAAWAYARYTNQVEVTKDLKWMIILESWRGLRVIPLANLFTADPSTYPITLPNQDLWWYNLLQQPVFYGSYLSQDSKYLITAIRSQGLIIFDVSQPSNPVQYYQIKIPGCPTRIEMVNTQNLLFYTDGIQLLAFQRVQPNMNDNFPNIFNGHQSKLFSYSSSFAQWRCYVSQEQTFIIAAQCGDLDFLQLKGGDPYNISLFKRMSAIQNTRTCTMVFYDNNRYMYRPVRENGAFMYIYDIQNIANYAKTDFPIVGTVKDSNPPRGEDLVFSKDENLLIVNYNQGIVILDSTDKFNLKILSYWNIPLQLNGYTSAIALTDDNKYCIVASRTIGMFFLIDISDSTKPNLINQIYTNGAELIVKSSIYQNIAYVCDGTSGFAILDLSALPQFKFISRITIDGWANHITLIQNEKYAIISSMDYSGMINVIDLNDLNNPYVLSKYIENNEQSISNCVLNNLQYAFSTSNKGLRIFPLKSQVAIHSSFYEIQPNNQLKAISNNLKIGQNILIQLLLIYIVDGMQIMDVFYYNNYQRNALPSWIQFIQINNSIQILVDKQGSQSLTTPTQNLLIIKTGIPITSQSFIYPEIPTDANGSQQIYLFLKESGIISSNNLVSSAFDPNTPLNLSSLQVPQSQRLNDLVILTLQRGIYYNPIAFTVSNSLTFDPTRNQMIETYSSEVTVQITIDLEKSTNGTFVQKQYQGVVVSISNNGASILIYGTVEAVNSVMKQKIFYYLNPNLNQINNFNVNLLIIDNLNPNLVINQSLSDAVDCYIHLKSLISQTAPLQQQINEQFSSAELTVLEQTTITFLANTFKDVDGFPINYEVEIKSSQFQNTFVALSSDYWLKFQPVSFTFNGIAPISLLNTQITIKVSATDGYSTFSDQFIIKLNKLPLSYILNLLFQIATPLLSFFGIYKYKYLFINSIYHKQVIYSQEKVNYNKLFVKCIPLLDQNVLLAQYIVNQYIKQLEKKKNVSQVLNKDLKPLSVREAQQPQEVSKDSSKEIFASKLKKKIKIKKNHDQHQNKQEHDIIEEQNDNLYQFQMQDGRIDMVKLIDDMDKINLTYKFFGIQRFFSKDRQKILQKNETLIFESIKILMQKFILKENKQLMDFYQFLQNEAIQSQKYSANDWYRVYIRIGISECEELQNKVVIEAITLNEVFQSFSVKEQQVIDAFQQYKEKIKRKNKLTELNTVHLNILKDVLIGDGIGIVDYELGYFKKCVGESLWLGMQNIVGIQAHVRDIDSCILPLKKCMNCDYLHYGLQNNMKLPNWLNFIHKNGLIILKGTPTEDDIEVFQIRISDISNYVVKIFNIEVLQNLKEIEEAQLKQKSFEKQKSQLTASTSVQKRNTINIQSLLQKSIIQINDLSNNFDRIIKNQKYQNIFKTEEKLNKSPFVKQSIFDSQDQNDLTEYTQYESSPQFQPIKAIFSNKSNNLQLIDFKNLNN